MLAKTEIELSIKKIKNIQRDGGKINEPQINNKTEILFRQIERMYVFYLFRFLYKM